MEFGVAAHPVNDGVLRLAVSGEIDLSTADVLHATITEALGSPGLAELYVDLSAVRFCDSAGVAALVDGQRAARELGATLYVINAGGTVRRVLTLTGVLDAI